MPGLKYKRQSLVWLEVWIGLLFLSLAYISPAAKARADGALPEKVLIEKFPVYGQQHNLSCEYSSTRMMTAFWGHEIGEEDFIRSIPFHPNPHVGFRGNIDGPFGGTWDYGIYPDPIAKFLETRGFKTRLLIGGVESLKQELALGRPVQVWVIAGMGWGFPFTENNHGLPFRLAGGEHSVVIYGYDRAGVYVADPAYGGQAYYFWDTFVRSWSYFDYMAISVWWPGAKESFPDEPAISYLFYRHWLNAGGLPLFGLPLAEAKTDGEKAYQYFERARLEIPHKGTLDQPVFAGLLGRELTQGRENETPFRPASPLPDPQNIFFSPTGHNLNQGFRNYWEKHGGLPAFGFPISEEFSEGGKVVQYFERSRFEFYPQNQEPYKILLGLVGREILFKG
jgi:uncharacterized protein YvpB